MPSSPLKVDRRYGGTYHLHRHSTLNIGAIFSTETSVEFKQTTRHYIPEDSTFHNHRCENLKSYITREDCKICMGRNGVHGGNVEITSVSKICVCQCLLYEDRLAQSPTDVVRQVVTGGNVAYPSSVVN
jgi:hypothetical protein